MTPPPAIQIDHLVKYYGQTRAIDDVSLAVERGEIFALLGPNGAGKTSTVEILEGFRQRDGGEVRVLGCDPARGDAAHKSRVGIMLQAGGIHPQIRPLEALEHYAAMYPAPDDPRRLIDVVGLADVTNTRYRQLSGGQQQRLSLALALVGRPELLFLDEPTTGLDPRARRDTWELIQTQASAGTTVFLTTHFMDEAERLADRVGIIQSGRLITVGTPRDVARSLPRDRLLFRTSSPIDVEELASILRVAVNQPSRGDYELTLTPTPGVINAITSYLLQHDILLTSLSVADQSLEDAYLAFTKEEGTSAS